ncbi:MAG: hypothetical protein AB7G76_12705 [Steroidobacteraceae bacterium]
MLRRERMQLLERLGPVTVRVTAAIASGNRGDWVDARRQLEEAEKILQIVLDETADRVMVDDASRERAGRLMEAEPLVEKEPGEERFND